MRLSPDVPTDVDVLKAVCDDLCAGVRTALSGKVLAYNPATLAAKVQPLRRGRTFDGQVFDLPVVPAAPVLWPRFAGMVMAGRLDPGDTCLLVVSDRELDPFLLTGALHDPVSPRRHDLTDAMVLPSLTPTTDPLTVGLGGAQLYLGQESGQAGIGIGIDVPNVVVTTTGPGTLQLGGPSAAQPIMLGTVVTTAIGAYVTAIATAHTAWLATVPPTAITNGTFIAALATATAVLGLTISTWLSTQVLAQ